MLILARASKIPAHPPQPPLGEWRISESFCGATAQKSSLPICTGRKRVVHSSLSKRRAICYGEASCPQPSQRKAVVFKRLEFISSTFMMFAPRSSPKTWDILASVRRIPVQQDTGMIAQFPILHPVGGACPGHQFKDVAVFCPDPLKCPKPFFAADHSLAPSSPTRRLNFVVVRGLWPSAVAPHSAPRIGMG